MLKKILSHPILHYSQDINDICRPLHQFGIHYFSHVRINKENEFTALCTHPAFAEHYLRKDYYNIDIHAANNSYFKDYVIWDALEFSGESAKLHKECLEFGIQNFFTLIKKENEVTNFYHFASHSASKKMNHIYLTNLDLLNFFIDYFNEEVRRSSLLSQAYQITFKLSKTHSGSILQNDAYFIDMQKMRKDFLHQFPQSTNRNFLSLSPQQNNCLNLLAQGFSSKLIADKLNLSPRTVEYYLMNIRKKMGYKNSHALLTAYIKANKS